MTKLSEAFARWREAWNGDGDAEAEAQAVWLAMSGAAKDSLHQMLFAARPVWDGDHLSKSGRDELIHAGLAVRVCHQGEQGYTSVVYAAYSIYKRVKGDEALRTGQLAAQARFRDLAAKTMRKRAHNAMSMWPWKRVKHLEVLLGNSSSGAEAEPDLHRESETMAEYQSFVDALPPNGAIVLVRSLTDTWRGDRELHFDANWFKPNNPRLLEPRTGIHLWYPERMEWKIAPNQPSPPTDAELWGESDGSATEDGKQ